MSAPHNPDKDASLPANRVDPGQILESSPDGIVVLDSKGHLLFVNQEAELILRSPRAAMLGSNVNDLFPASDVIGKTFAAHFEQALYRQKAGSYDLYSETASRWLQIRLIPCRLAPDPAKGDRHGVTVYFRDMTERWEAEQSHAESEERFRTLADAAPALIWMSGSNTICDWFNKTWLDFTGRSMGEELGNGWSERVHPTDFDRCIYSYLTAFATRQTFTREYRLKRHDGEWRWLLDTGAPRFEADGTFTGFIGSCIDVTERKSAEQERERFIRDLQDANRRQRRFLQEMLAGFTEGRLRLCFTPDEIPSPLPPCSEIFPLGETSLTVFRHRLRSIAQDFLFADERIGDLLTATHEAAMNAVLHGGGGSARIHGSRETGTIQVRIEDHGPGIAEERIHRAIEQGFTTGGFGQGFFFMQSCTDRLYLLSTANVGTTVILEMDRVRRDPYWLSPDSSLHR